MAKVPVAFEEWRPDIALLDTKFASEVDNVFPGVNSYIPCPALAAFSAAALVEPAPGKVCGLYSARKSDGTWQIYAGTTTGLYKWGYAGWTDVTGASGPYNVRIWDLWSFEQSGQHLVAVNINDPPQWIEIDDAGAVFEDLPGSPPNASNVKQIGDFLFLSGLAEDTDPSTLLSDGGRRVIWSSINDITGWTVGTNLCDEQIFPDNGPVMGIAGAEIGYAVQDRGIRTIQFLPGDTTFIFNFSRVLHDRGCISRYGFTSIGNVLYFNSEDGFYALSGQQVVPVGADKVNDWFLANSDVGRRNVVQAISGVNKPRIAWAFYEREGSQTYDKVIIYDWSNQRWSKVTESAQVWGLLASPGLDLDTTGPEVNDVELDTPPTPAARELDSFAYVGGRPQIGGIDPDGYLAALTGPNLPAIMETAEVHLVPGFRAYVSEAYPLDDVSGSPGTVSAGIRESLHDGLPVFVSPVDIERTGSAALFTSSRLHRFRRTIPASSTWTHAQGIVVEVQQDGTVA